MSHRRGFSLIELLVVVAILAVLVALLVPAVQKARETANRTRCLNNVKQLGIALHNYAHTHQGFPPGCTPSPKKHNATDYDYGHSWMALILPFTDQTSLFDTLDLAGQYYTTTGLVYANPNPSGNNSNAYNGNILAGLDLKIYFCPSSPLPRFTLKNLSPPGPLGVLSPTYTAVGGAVDHPSTLDRDATTNIHNAIGKLSYGGIMTLHHDPEDKPRAIAEVIDGTSCTLLVAEQSDWCVANNGAKKNCRSDYGHGFTMGPRSNEHRNWNTTSVRYAINNKAWNQTGVGDDLYGCNRPIQSVHPGGAHGLLGDGSARFLHESMPLQVLYDLSNRDDGHVVPGNY
jgi:prepilin-type N-terminal cleavage/methylation domain-containing protein